MTTPPRPTDPHSERIPDELVDRFFDRELDEGSREKFFGMIRGDLPRCAQVAKTQRLVSMLREPVQAPDLTDVILEKMRRRRAFLPPRLRFAIKAGRLAAAACIALGILAIALTQRYAPGALRLAPEPSHLSGVIESSASDLADAVGSVKARVAEAPISAAHAAPQPAPRSKRFVLALSPGATSVRVLPPTAPESPLPLYTGSGGERFVFAGNAVYDRSAPTSTAFGLLAPGGSAQGECTDAWITALYPAPAIPAAVAAPVAHQDVRGQAPRK